MQYNILHGFYNPLHNKDMSFDFEGDRLMAAQKAVKKENPDVLVLNEACFAEKSRWSILMDYPKLFNYPHHYHAPSGYEWGISVLSRFPIVERENYSLPNCPFARITLDLKGYKLGLNVLHPHPTLTEEEKMRFVQSSLRDIKHPCLVVGDFNALSDEDDYNFDKLYRGFSNFDKHASNTVKEFKKRLPIRAILDKRLRDTFIVARNPWNYTIPTDHCSKNKDSAMRIDYIFCSNDIGVKDAYVVKNNFTEKASDHYPIVAVLDIKKK